jgi:hypothetical protein
MSFPTESLVKSDYVVAEINVKKQIKTFLCSERVANVLAPEKYAAC